MIIDSLSNLEKYVKLLPQLKTVRKVLDSGVLNTAAPGPYKTDDPDVRYNVSEYSTHAKGDHGYEVHQREADVQILLKGHECMDTAFGDSLKERAPYNEQKDAQYFDGKLQVSYKADEASFVVFFPGEAHEPCITDGQTASIHKVVFKILIK